MHKINAFTHVSVDGYFAGPHGEIDWFKTIGKDPEYEAFTHRQAKSGGPLLMGRTTYEMMKSYWPTAEAAKTDPQMAEVMRNSPKIVVSRKLASVPDETNWKNITVLREIKPQEIAKLKERESNDITILGSGSIVQQLANLRLLDEFHLVVVPHVLGQGKPLFKDVKDTDLKLIEAKSFKNGITWLSYGSA
jgi:dihydrofolate reductase